jgi:hypothetical protein
VAAKSWRIQNCSKTEFGRPRKGRHGGGRVVFLDFPSAPKGTFLNDGDAFCRTSTVWTEGLSGLEDPEFTPSPEVFHSRVNISTELGVRKHPFNQ